MKLLISRRIAPSPDNYRKIYNEIRGVTEKPLEGFPERELKSFIASLPKENPSQQRLSRELDQALKPSNWDEFRHPLTELIKEHSTESDLN